MTGTTTDRLVGDVLDGRYEVMQRLARGGMATVYRAWDRRLERIVAIKVMHDGLGDDDDFVAKFDREARAAARLCDETVVSIFDQGYDHGRPYIVMEFVEGCTLRSIITRDAPMTPLRAIQIIEPVAAALAVAHDAGLIHRDVKPENVLISDRGAVKVADFGLARTVTSQTSTRSQGLLIGTVSYLPPELLTTGRAFSWSDVYSTGIMLFEMLTGTKPYTGDAPITVAYKHVNESVPAPSSVLASRNAAHAKRSPIPDYLDALVLSCTRRDPERRPLDGRALLRHIRLIRRALEQGVRSDDALCAVVFPMSKLSSSSAHTVTLDPDLMPTSVMVRPKAAMPESPHGPSDAAAGIQSNRYPRNTIGSTTAASSARLSPSAPMPAASSRPSLRPSSNRRQRPVSPVPAPLRPVSARERYPQLSKLSSRYRRRRAIVTIAIVVLAVVIGITSWWFVSGRYVPVPAVINLTRAEAENAAANAGLSIDFTEDYSETVASDLIISSDPAPGEEVIRGHTMTAVVSLGPERFATPALAGLTLDDAKSALVQANLKVGKVTEEWSETVSSGHVISAGAGNGDLLKRDTPVDLAVSKGREPLTIVSVVGQKKDDAEKALTSAGFKIKYADETASKDVPAGSVISQDPAEGTGYRGDTITVVISKGPNLIAVPAPNSKEKPSAYADRLSDAKFVPEFVYSGLNLGPNIGKIAKVTDDDDKELTDDSKLPEGAKIKIYVSL